MELLLHSRGLKVYLVLVEFLMNVLFHGLGLKVI